MTTYALNFEEMYFTRVDNLRIGSIVIMPPDQLDFGDPIGTLSAANLLPTIVMRESLTKNTCQPQLAAYLFAITRKAQLMNRYFPLTNTLDPHAEADFHRLIGSIAQNSSFDIRLIGEKHQDRSAELPSDALNIVAGHIAEIFFYRRDLLNQFLSQRRGFYLYTTPQAYADDGGVAGGCYNPQRDAIQLVLSRLYEGFSAPTPGVAPFIHEFGHMLDHASGNRGLIPGMDAFIDLFRRGKKLELERSQQLRQTGKTDVLPIGHPYVFQNDGEFIAGYLEMFFRNPHTFAAQNDDLYQAFARCLKQDPRQYWKEDFPFYIQQNRNYYASQRPPKPGITLPTIR